MVAAAIGVSALVGGVTSVVSGNKSANAITDAADSSNAVQKYMYDQTRADYAPWKAVGTNALGKLAGMYGVSPTGSSGGTFGGEPDWQGYLNANPDVMSEYTSGRAHKSDFPTIYDYAQWHYNTYGKNEGRDLPTTGGYTAPVSNDNSGGTGDFWKSPDYQFGLDEGRKAIERSAAARGGLVSGATAKSLDRYASDYASGQYNNYVNRLMALAGFGTQATGATSAAGQNYATNVSVNNGNAGNARASAYQNTGAAINNGVTNLASMYLYQKGAGGFGGGGAYGGNLGGIY